MKYFVNDSCIGCGLCANICPEVFEMTDEGVAKAKAKDIDADGEILEKAQEAQNSCPVAAIEEA